MAVVEGAAAATAVRSFVGFVGSKIFAGLRGSSPPPFRGLPPEVQQRNIELQRQRVESGQVDPRFAEAERRVLEYMILEAAGDPRTRGLPYGELPRGYVLQFQPPGPFGRSPYEVTPRAPPRAPGPPRPAPTRPVPELGRVPRILRGIARRFWWLRLLEPTEIGDEPPPPRPAPPEPPWQTETMPELEVGRLEVPDEVIVEAPVSRPLPQPARSRTRPTRTAPEPARTTPRPSRPARTTPRPSRPAQAPPRPGSTVPRTGRPLPPALPLPFLPLSPAGAGPAAGRPAAPQLRPARPARAGPSSPELSRLTRSQARRRDCECPKPKQQKRKDRTVCWKGFFSERTRTEKRRRWVRVDCTTGRELS